jgi:hypothetical protein
MGHQSAASKRDRQFESSFLLTRRSSNLSSLSSTRIITWSTDSRPAIYCRNCSPTPAVDTTSPPLTRQQGGRAARGLPPYVNVVFGLTAGARGIRTADPILQGAAFSTALIPPFARFRTRNDKLGFGTRKAGKCSPSPTSPQALQSTKRLILMLRKAEVLHQPLHRQ